jgi:plasmid stability protein
MATLYVESIPDELYEALRHQARQHKKSIASEIVSLLEQNVVTSAEHKARQEFLRRVQRLRSRRSSASHFQDTEQLQREDRAR